MPIGLINNNWGGTPVEHWSTPASLESCGVTRPDSTLYNSMINPCVQPPRPCVVQMPERGVCVCVSCIVPPVWPSWPRSTPSPCELEAACTGARASNGRPRSLSGPSRQGRGVGGGWGATRGHKGCTANPLPLRTPTRLQVHGGPDGADRLHVVSGVCFEGEAHAGALDLCSAFSRSCRTSKLFEGDMCQLCVSQGEANTHSLATDKL